MTVRAGRLRRVVALVFGLVGALVVGLVTVLAVRSDGYATTSVDLTQRSVWVTNAEKFMVGRLNRQINELDSAAILDSPDMDVLQQDDTVVVVDDKAHQARLLDPANGLARRTADVAGERPRSRWADSSSRSRTGPPEPCGSEPPARCPPAT